MMICDKLMFLIHAVLSTGIHTVHPCVVTCTDGDLHGMMWWMEAGRDGSGTQSILCIVHVHDVVTDWSYALVGFLVSTLFCGSPGQS